jgi:hypothetical protein
MPGYSGPDCEQWGFMDVSAGVSVTCALTYDGAIDCWGYEESSIVTQAPSKGGFSSIAVGQDFACAATPDGVLTCWGANLLGQSEPPSGSGYTSLEAGTLHACAISSAGKPVCWGNDSNGQVSLVPDIQAMSISAGSEASCAINTFGVVSCWPEGAIEGSIPQAPQGQAWFDVSVGYDHACLRTSAQHVTCWGASPYGQATGTPGQPLQYSGATSVSAGGAHSCLIDELTSSLKCWGQTGNFPAAGSQGEAGDFVQVSTGTFHTCARTTEGSISCWTSGAFGQEATPEPFD